MLELRIRICEFQAHTKPAYVSMPRFILCPKSSGTAHLGDLGATRGLEESGTYKKIQWVTKQGLESPWSWAVNPQGLGHTETRGQTT